jgi:hypothetical protein
MGENISEFVSWLQDKGQDLTPLSNKLRDDVAKTMENGYNNAKSNVLSRKDLDDTDMQGMMAILQKPQNLKIKPETGSCLVRRMDAITRSGTECDGCMGNLR